MVYSIMDNFSEQTSIDGYLKMLAPVDDRVLTREEEVEYFKRMEEGDDEAKNEFANHNLRLVISIAKEFSNTNKRKRLSMIDLIQEGNCGLMKAINKFDYHKGNKFSTYAVDWIHQTIDRSIDKNGRTIKVPSSKLYVVKQYTKIKSDIQKKTGVQPTFDEVTKHLEWTKDYIKYCLGLGIEPLSFSQSVTSSGSDYDKRLEDVIGDSFQDEDNEDVIENDLLNMTLSQVIDDVLEDDEKEVISYLFGFNKSRTEYTIDEVAEIMHVSHESVVACQHHAFQTLRASDCLEQLSVYMK